MTDNVESAREIADKSAVDFPWDDNIPLRDPLAAYKACARHAALAALESSQSDMRELADAVEIAITRIVVARSCMVVGDHSNLASGLEAAKTATQQLEDVEARLRAMAMNPDKEQADG